MTYPEIDSGTDVRINYPAGSLVDEPGTYVGWGGGWHLVYPNSDAGRECVMRNDGCLLLTSTEFVIED